MGIEGINIGMSMKNLNSAAHAVAKPATVETNQSAAEEAAESPAQQASEGEKGGLVNVYA